jgi:putative membrane protein
VSADPQSLAAAIESAVAEAETHTAAEIVVVCARSSGSYRDLGISIGASVALLTLAFLVYSPFPLNPAMWPVEVAVVGGLATWLALRWPGLSRLASPARRKAQVRLGAEAAFYQERVFATAERSGVLVYISWAESEAVLIPDEGLLGSVPGEAWPMVAIDASTAAGVSAGITRLGQILAAHVPRAEDDTNELSNAPVLR